MSNIVAALKDEISRLARKEIKNQTMALKKTSAYYRRAFAEMKRRVADLEGKVSFLKKHAGHEAPPQVDDKRMERVRFSPRGLRTHRSKLGLSAANYGKLIGVTGKTIYYWESEESRPRKQQLAALAAIRGMGKKEAGARLNTLAPKSPKSRKRRKNKKR
jgi:DNA-binding transcriptional regulator YiaG